jgi:hypothetical protein
MKEKEPASMILAGSVLLSGLISYRLVLYTRPLIKSPAIMSAMSKSQTLVCPET